MATRGQRRSAKSSGKTKTSIVQRRPKRTGKDATPARSARATARKSATRKKRESAEIPAAPQPDIQEEAGATVYPGRQDVAHPGMTGVGERINAEDHSSPRSRLHDGSTSVVRQSEETGVAERADRPAGDSDVPHGPGESARTSDERSGAAGPASPYYEESGERLDETHNG
jgi:hypothetical protein